MQYTENYADTHSVVSSRRTRVGRPRVRASLGRLRPNPGLWTPTVVEVRRLGRPPAGEGKRSAPQQMQRCAIAGVRCAYRQPTKLRDCLTGTTSTPPASPPHPDA